MFRYQVKYLCSINNEIRTDEGIVDATNYIDAMRELQKWYDGSEDNDSCISEVRMRTLDNVLSDDKIQETLVTAWIRNTCN